VSELADGFERYYQARLWDSLPEMYQTMDIIGDDGAGPLRELLNRIGVQAAVVRRSIDGLWADQFIETCADWVIPYIGELVAAREVTGLDPRGQRLNVANAVRWRRWKGTLPTAAAVARAITGWDVLAVEAFRGLARTRHDLDPPLSAGGLLEPLTRTPAGGLADLRSAPAAQLAGGPFGQAFHHADLRRGNGTAGWFGPEKLVVYCWRLLSLEVTGATPVRVSGRDSEYVFDPTGREVPLFLPPPAISAESAESAGSRSWAVPGPLTAAVERLMADAGAPAAYRITGVPADPAQPAAVPPAAVPPVAVRPEVGRFRLTGPGGPAMTVSYHYGFAGPVGAGTGVLAGRTTIYAVGEGQPVAGGVGLEAALAGAQAGDTVTIADSLTYTAVADVGCGVTGQAGRGAGAPAPPLTVRARPGERPLIRLGGHGHGRGHGRGREAERPQWVFTGGPGARLVLDGLFVSGGDIVLRGSFDHVKIVGCTFDPGTLAAGEVPGVPSAGVPDMAARRRRAAGGAARAPVLAVGQSVDGRALLPTRVWIEPAPRPPGQSAGRPPMPPDIVRCLEIDHSVLGPVRTRGGGLAEQVMITDSILQGFRPSAQAALTAADIFDPPLLYDQLSPGRATPEQARAQANPLSAFLWRSAGAGISPAVRRELRHAAEPPVTARAALAGALNDVIGRAADRPERWAGVPLGPQTRALLERAPAGEDPGGRGLSRADREARSWLGRLLLEDAYPLALAPAACALAAATVQLNRVTILGRVIARRLQATDSLLDGFTVADDIEDGGFRFSAARAGGRLPRQFNSVALSVGAALFTSTAFGQPGYAQLLDTADRAIVAGPSGRTLLAGSSAGGQIGAFPAQAVPVKERALRVEYDEYLPLGVVPVIVHVT
jgi:hypothetical protein